MKFKLETAEVFVPNGLSEKDALKQTTHMAIGAHQDDIEIIAFHGIIQCFHNPKKWFTGVTVTNGSGSPRDGIYKNYTDKQMRKIRIAEQKKAAIIGEYTAHPLLDYPSSVVKDGSNKDPVEDLANLIDVAQPEVIYTHNLADKHDTHVAVALRVIEAIRSLPESKRPKQVFGCETWRDLDWLPDEDKIMFECSEHENMQMALLGVFDSQIAGGKRYDLATMGRRRAHATYHASHSTDVTTGITYGMDLTPLIKNPNKDIGEFTQDFIDDFAKEVSSAITRLMAK